MLPHDQLMAMPLPQRMQAIREEEYYACSTEGTHSFSTEGTPPAMGWLFVAVFVIVGIPAVVCLGMILTFVICHISQQWM